MKGFEIYVNGQHLITAGIGDDGFLTSSLTWVGSTAPKPASHLHLHVGGTDHRTSEQVNWSVPSVGVGDEITIKIIETDQITPEHRRYKPDGA